MGFACVIIFPVENCVGLYKSDSLYSLRLYLPSFTYMYNLSLKYVAMISNFCQAQKAS